MVCAEMFLFVVLLLYLYDTHFQTILKDLYLQTFQLFVRN